jgi:hypothetical protein
MATIDHGGGGSLRNDRDASELQPKATADEAHLHEDWGRVPENPVNAAWLEELIALRLGPGEVDPDIYEAERERILAEEARIGRQLARALAVEREHQKAEAAARSRRA